MAIGIEALNCYVGRACFEVEDLFRERGLDIARLGNLMMTRKSVNLPCEDAVTNAVNAARPLLAAMDERDRADIELLVVGTESGVDMGKPISTYVHRHLELSPRCRSFEVKHACYGGTAALHTAAGIIAHSPVPRAKALVIAADVPGSGSRGTYWEPSEGAGAVAMIVSRDCAVLELDVGASGTHTFEVMDTLRPSADVAVVDSDLSLLSYLTCLEHSFAVYRERVVGSDVVDTFAYLVFHTPFAGMVKGAHRMLLRKQGALASKDADTDFTSRVAPTVKYASQVGNLFSASLYLALASLLGSAMPVTPARIGLFSYGSGCGSEFFSGVLGADGVEAVGRFGIGERIASRRALTMAEYDQAVALGGDRGHGVAGQAFETGPYAELYAELFDGAGLLVLDHIDRYHRVYRWS
ncbi:hydroxymethylglutaryl-CoA synthase family protein [Frankia sp. CcWB3]